MTEQDMKNLEAMFQRYVGTVYEDFQSKLDLVVEGQEAIRHDMSELSHKTDERFDLVDFKIDTLNQKIDGVATDLKATDERLTKKIDGVEEKLTKKIDGVSADLKAHRADTEAHHGVYQVRES